MGHCCFPQRIFFSWVGIGFIQETDYKKPNPNRIILEDSFCFIALPCSVSTSHDRQAVQQYLVSELSSRDKTREGLFATEPTPPRNSPRQDNGSDCGVLMLHVMEVGRGSGIGRAVEVIDRA